jgi:hypothetical protein
MHSPLANTRMSVSYRWLIAQSRARSTVGGRQHFENRVKPAAARGGTGAARGDGGRTPVDDQLGTRRGRRGRPGRQVAAPPSGPDPRPCHLPPLICRRWSAAPQGREVVPRPILSGPLEAGAHHDLVPSLRDAPTDGVAALPEGRVVQLRRPSREVAYFARQPVPRREPLRASRGLGPWPLGLAPPEFRRHRGGVLFH